MKVLVVDDEPLARRRLLRMLERMPDVAGTDQAEDAQAALERIRADRPDLVLLDIRMPGLSGLELAASHANLPPVVFTTAYDEHALEAFEVSAVDYLLKPVQRERLAAALDKVRRRTAPRAEDTARLRSLLEKLDRRVASDEPTRLAARSGGTTRFFEAREITRIYASEKYSLFRHGGREYVLDESLALLEARLGEEGFVRVHRAELVNVAHIRALHSEDGASRVELSDGQRARVSRRSLPALKERLRVR